MKNLTEEQERLLKTIVDNFEQEDRSVRERQIRTWRRLKFLWDGIQRIWYSETAHDWRIYDVSTEDENQQDYYDKPVNVFRAYLESIIAALSVSIPSVKCYPDDADNTLDLQTAKAGDKIAELISRHNDVSLVWLHGLFIYCTEGLVAAYNYTKEDESYGTYEEPEYEDTEEEVEAPFCTVCGEEVDPSLVDQEKNEFDPGPDDVSVSNVLGEGGTLCPKCLSQMDPEFKKSKVIVTRLIGVTNKPKSRQCIEVYGGLYVKVANYAKKQADTPYLIWSYETNFTFVRDRYPELRDKIGPNMGQDVELYEIQGRTNPQYYGEQPLDNVTIRNIWLRPSAFEFLEDEKEVKELKKLFPNGVKIVMANDHFAEAVNESLDDHWTLTHNPLSDFLYFDPIGLLLTSIQEITNDLVSLTLQTIEHGIPQTIADPKVLNFEAYRNSEATPGAIIPGTPKSGKSMAEGFYEVKTATLSGEILPFANMIQEFGQTVSGALPALAGGQIQGGSGTASEYSMSRSQAQQRLGMTWKMFTVFWKQIYGKVIPAYINTVKDDQRFVQKNDTGGFVNILIKKAELEGKIGSIEIEANENLPISWSQRRDVINKLMETNNPQLLAMLAQPENLPLIYESIGIVDFYVPGEESRVKQLDEIKELLNSEPIVLPPDETMAIESGMPPEPIELPSVEVDPVFDEHPIEFATCQKWANSEAGQQAKRDNPQGYKNVLLHGVQHKEQMMLTMTPEGGTGAAPLESPTQDKNAPITGEGDVQTE